MATDIKRVLVTGGAGYIGSHLCRMLEEMGFEVHVLDLLKDGTDLANAEAVSNFFDLNPCDLVVHLAASLGVRESARDPKAHYRNNVIGTIHLLDEMKRRGITRLVFSSTAAVYGHGEGTTLAENHPKAPISPYGTTKLCAENAISDYSAYGLRSIIFRFFNVAGCEPGIHYLESETLLIPTIMREAWRLYHERTVGEARLSVFGNDYPTPDGTCIRDYVHVTDICQAHVLAIQRVAAEDSSSVEIYNLGSGTGFSVLEIIRVACQVTGVDIRFRIGKRQPGEPPRLVANCSKAMTNLGWSPRESGLERILQSVWNRMMRVENRRLKDSVPDRPG